MQQFSEEDRIVRLVSENGLHLRQCLHPHAFEKDIKLSEIFYKYYDIRRQYKLFKDTSTSFLTLRHIAEGKRLFLIVSYKGYRNISGSFYQDLLYFNLHIDE